MADPTLFAALAVNGITVTSRVDVIGGTQSCYYCLGGPNYRRDGRWVTVTTADSDGTKQTAIQSALS